MNDTLLYLGKALHKMQAERGSSVLFVSSNGKLHEKELREAFKDSHDAFEDIRIKLKEWQEEHFFDDDFLNKMEIILNNTETVKSRREKIINLEFNSTEIINGYSHNVISPLMDLMVMVALFDKNNDSTKVSAYSYFLQLKEKFGRERALGARGLANGSFSNKEFIDRFRFLISEQESFERTFLAMANDQQKKVYTSRMKGNVVHKISAVHAIMKQSRIKDLPDISAIEWFKLTSEKMDLMRAIEKKLINGLRSKDITVNNSSLASQIKTMRQIDGISSEQRTFIEKMPFFTDLPEPIVTSVLQHAQVKEYKKNKLLFLEGEASNRLHIILSGWIKLFKGTSSGDETILQMLTGGDMIAESAVFLNANYPVSAQVAKTAIILSLPASIIREKIKEHNDLALKVLDGISKHSYSLIQEFENIRLKPATERVGWFLLKLLLQQGKIPDLIELPYDKSLIASYLDMKPETFSRTLKRFKNNGFIINKSSVILPGIRSLCGFCDHDLASNCEKHSTPDCPNPACNNESIINF